MTDNDKLITKPKKYKGNDGYKTFSIGIKAKPAESIDSISAGTGYGRNGLIGIFQFPYAFHLLLF